MYFYNTIYELCLEVVSEVLLKIDFLLRRADNSIAIFRVVVDIKTNTIYKNQLSLLFVLGFLVACSYSKTLEMLLTKKILIGQTLMLLMIYF